ncbi:nucleoporin complex subunit 54-domain-containing protein [Suillus bovinus]|uniref:nucleoporin complex subunit 54-domain-containing protein n=1 Tax=Suillus bovinus TaxID=48563 RepID=UPI001B87B96C|nr:nucleoporin complex subunit 54-domain-containing protein [Suillus bovinus]KAG2159353.1 nucleoporin complex subunit 54-domain-containing protein [Suillus bovinus]
MSLFGGTATQPSTNIFGTANAQQQPGQTTSTTNTQQQPGQTIGAQTTGIFGNTNSQQQPGQATGGSIFGNTATQPSTSGTTLFGTPSTATSTTAGAVSGSLFGNTTMPQQPAGTGSSENTSAQPQQQPAAGSSGNTQQPAASGLFGNTTANTTQQPATGGLFGSTNSNTQTQTQPAGTSLFGNTLTQPTGNLFGAAGSQQQQPQQPQQGGSLFGGTTTQQQQPQSSGLFGGAPTQQPATGAGGLFGTSTTQPSTGGNLFGGTSSQAPTSGGLFGSTTAQAPATGGGLFGSTTTNSNPLFGNKNPASIFGTAPAPSSTTPTLFGQSQSMQPIATPSLFGQSQQKLAGSLFGSVNQPAPSTTTGGLFGSTLGLPLSNSLLASRSAAPAQQQDHQSQYAALEQKIQAIVQAWDPSSPACRFQHYFYNLVPPTQVSAFGRPANATNEALWQRAVHDNPDPSCMVPVLAVGFDDLRQRVDGQMKQATEQQKALMELKKRLESLSARHNDSNASRLQRAKSIQSQTQHRLLCLIQHMHLMLPTVRSTAIRPEEEALRLVLEEIEEEIRRPGGMSKMRGKLNELWALVGAINAARERGRRVGLDGTSEWTVVDEEGLKQIAQILSNQQAGLQHLTKVLQHDLKDLEVIYGRES